MAGTATVFFGSDRMVYLVLHPELLTLTDAQVTELIDWSNARSKDLFNKRIFKDVATAPLIQRAANDQTLLSCASRKPSYFPASKLPDGNAEGHFRPGVSAPESFTVLFPDVPNTSRANLVLLAHNLDDQRTSFTLKGNDKVQLHQVSLNWLTSVTNGGLGSGGPGGHPTPYTGNVSTAHPFTLPPAIVPLLPLENQRGDGVEVAILDTCPTGSDLARANNKLGGQHPLLGPMLNGQLERPTPTVIPGRQDIYNLKHHHYDMADHGLFAAGIIHSIAPRARLHLIEVLDHFGAGDSDSISHGLATVVNMIANQAGAGRPGKWVVNCSLMMNAPTDDSHVARIIYELENQGTLTPAEEQEQGDLLGVLKPAANNPGDPLLVWLMTRQAGAIQFLCDYLYAYLGTRVIAAAGNDRLPSLAQPAARFPANADSVLGVGALKKLDPRIAITPASYTNHADNPTSAGVVTFGGEEGADVGVLGAYIGAFPASMAGKNPTGWAWWCGTSFATPIVTGMTAALLSMPNAYATTEDAIEEFFKQPHAQLPNLEAIWQVTQP